MPSSSPLEDLGLVEGDLSLEALRNNAGFDGFAVLRAGDRVGSVALRSESPSTHSVRWNLGTGPEALGLAVRALRLVVDHVFGALGSTRIEARIPVDRTDDLRAASIVGLRREGTTRGAGDEPDRALVARLADDPPLSGPGAFIPILNAGLPTKRVISQGLLRDPDGRVLLCELTYKAEWDLPGGVVEVGESPATGLVRELEEELGLTVEVQGLVTVNWLPAWHGWDDACIFLFDLGVVDADFPERFTLQPTEIADVHWCDPATIDERATAAARELLAHVREGQPSGYREAPLAP